MSSRPSSSQGARAPPTLGTYTPTQRRQSPPRGALHPHHYLAPPVPLPAKQDHTTRLAHKLLHIFDPQKAATFHATVTIHELANVPQLAGEFAVEWKFRGRRPKDPADWVQKHEQDKRKDSKDRQRRGIKRHSGDKPSLPDLQSAHAAYSASSLSLRSNSTAASPSKPGFPYNVATPSARSSTPSTPTSLRTFSTDLEATPHPPAAGDPDSVPPPRKRISDPSSLRQSTGPDSLTASPQNMSSDLPTESPAQMEEDSRQSYFAPNARSTARTVPLPRPGHANTIAVPPKAQTNLPRLVPPGRIAARSGTNPSVSTILDTLPDSDRPRRPRTVSRASSHATTASMVSFDSNSSPDSRRHHSGSSEASQSSEPGVSHARRGITPAGALVQHSCQWDYQVQHTLRIPLGKDIPPSLTPGVTTPRNARQPAPCLGQGPYSDSGLHLTIYQMPSSNALTAHPASESNSNLSHTLAAVHHARHPEKKGDRHAAAAETHKTVFGTVDIDLAPFAGKAPSTRRFLLKGTKTNAVVKVSVDMRFIGGEEHWHAPPMREGHHVSGIQHLVSNDVDERLKADLKQAPDSESSSSSSSVLTRTRTNGSMISMAPTNMSTASLVGPDPSSGYKSYEHHLRPSISRKQTDKSQRSVSGENKEPKEPKEPKGIGAKLEQFKFHNLSHRHHSHHSHHLREMPAIQQFGMHDLAPDVVIEAVFNPYAGNEASPFTFVQPTIESSDAPTADAEIADEAEAEAEGYDVELTGGTVKAARGRGRWGFRGKMGRKEKDRRMGIPA